MGLLFSLLSVTEGLKRLEIQFWNISSQKPLFLAIDWKKCKFAAVESQTPLPNFWIFVKITCRESTTFSNISWVKNFWKSVHESHWLSLNNSALIPGFFVHVTPSLHVMIFNQLVYRWVYQIKNGLPNIYAIAIRTCKQLTSRVLEAYSK